jgi:hypothetical protein
MCLKAPKQDEEPMINPNANIISNKIMIEANTSNPPSAKREETQHKIDMSDHTTL